MKRILGAVGILVGGAIVILGYLAWTPGKPVDGAAIRQAASNYEARVIRDAYGVPHVYAERDADAAFGLAFAHAEDDWATIQEVVALSRGELARYKGTDSARSDYLVRAFEVWPLIEARYETDLAPETRALLDGYAAGLNLYGLENPDETWDAILPVTGKDVVAGFVFRTPFFFGLEGELEALFAESPQKEVSDEPVTTALLSGSGEPVELGSNGIAVDRNLSADGTVRLWINSHQPFKGHVAWYEMRIKTEQGWDVAGGIFPGSPVMLHGHNRYLGWANTVNRPDLIDIYKLETDPEDATRYRFDGEWREMERETAEIRVKLWGPFSWVFEEEIRRSVHGPVFGTDHGDYAIRHAGQGAVGQIEQWYRLNKADTLIQWLDAMSMQAIPSLNFVYADVDGYIAYIYNGRFPDRAEGWDWQAYLPGDTPDVLWTDFLGWDQVPKVFAPSSGYLINANNTPFRVTAEGQNLPEDRFAEEMGIESRMTNRALRALELFGSDDSITREEFLDYKFDKAFSAQSRMARMIDEIAALDLDDSPDLQAGRDLLVSWDRRATEDSRATALAVLTGWHAGAWLTRQDADWKVPLRHALEHAAEQLMAAYGRLDVEWGTVMRHRRGDVDEPVGGAPDVLRAIYSDSELDDAGTLTASVGDSLIILAEWDDAGNLTSHTVHPYGSATLDDSSPHFDDQAKMFADEEFKRLPLDKEALLEQATRDYTVGGQEPSE